MEQAMKDGEGCNIEGWLEVLRVAGNFHVSVHSQVVARASPGVRTDTLVAVVGMMTVICCKHTVHARRLASSASRHINRQTR